MCIFFLFIPSIFSSCQKILTKKCFRVLLPESISLNDPLYNPSHREDFPVLGITDFNTRARRARMHYLPVSDVNCHMAGITYNISRLCIGIINSAPRIPLGIGSPRNRITKITEYPISKPGTIRTVCQARPAAHIGIPHELTGIIGNLLPRCAPART